MSLYHIEITFQLPGNKRSQACPVTCTVRTNGSQSYFEIEVSARGEEWDEPKQRFTEQKPQAELWNAYLDIIRSQLLTIWIRLESEQRERRPLAGEIVEAYLGQG